MTWVLFVVLLAQGRYTWEANHIATAQVQFASKDLCEAAKEQLMQTSGSAQAFCFKRK